MIIKRKENFIKLKKNMIVKLFFPVLNTDDINSNSDINLDVDDYSNMLDEQLKINNFLLNDFHEKGFNSKQYYYVSQDIIREKELNLEYYECEAFVKAHNGSDLTEDELCLLSEHEKMGVILLNINPNSLEYEVYSDLKTWLNESVNIINENAIDNRNKITLLPYRDLKLEINNKNYFLSNCKIIENKSSEKFPFNFVLLIEKIIKN